MKCVDCEYYVGGIYENDDWCKHLRSYITPEEACNNFEETLNNHEREYEFILKKESKKGQ